MALTDPSNTIFQKAVAFVNQTNRHLFLTGKAGTGKTTFLKYIRENCTKKMAVVAPTGVAAINAGGVTIHSFFQLPFGSFIPVQTNNWQSYDGRINNLHSLFKNLRMTNARRDLLRELELLVIDEVSMVRADVLDMIDAVLRHFRRQPLLPFGGVQMLYIGDLFQLPPVVRNDEWDVLRSHYRSPFFFDAHAIQHAPPVYIELKKIYRQSDSHFIEILNNIRNNTCSAANLEELHKYYKPGYEPAKDENYITLTSHNARADTINDNQLKLLPGKTRNFEAEITGDFGENMFPVEKIMTLKEGAQVMFIKNDKGESRRYYNGKIATVKKISSDSIWVSFPGEDVDFELEKEEWVNKKFNYNKEKDNVEEEALGSFTQYPIRLAWAITIHKSQGLTFDKAIIDAGSSFAPGQVYVALSRLTNLQGLVLFSRINQNCISTDPRVLDFVKNEIDDDKLQEILEKEQRQYIRFVLLNSFNWNKIVDLTNLHYEAYETRQIPDKNLAIEIALKWVEAVAGQQKVADAFIKRLEFLFHGAEADNYNSLNERTSAAAAYFENEINEHIINPLKKHLAEMKVKSKTKKYVKELNDLYLVLERKKLQLKSAVNIADALHKSANMNELLDLVQETQKPREIELVDDKGKPIKTEKTKKGDTNRVSLEMFKEGKSIAEIAAGRGFAPSTIESHLTQFIKSGEVDIHSFISPEKLKAAMEVINAEPKAFLSAYKEKLGNDYSFGEIKAAMKWWEREVGIE